LVAEAEVLAMALLVALVARAAAVAIHQEGWARQVKVLLVGVHHTKAVVAAEAVLAESVLMVLAVSEVLVVLLCLAILLEVL
jgi:hypothetical protein